MLLVSATTTLAATTLTATTALVAATALAATTTLSRIACFLVRHTFRPFFSFRGDSQRIAVSSIRKKQLRS
jgi:hypothetical protein